MAHRAIHAIAALAVFIAESEGLRAADAVTSPGVRLGAIELRDRIDHRIDEARFAGARWGVLVVSLDSGRLIYSRNENLLFIPASNTKLFTAGLALERLGADFRVRTSLYGHERPDRQGRLRGDLLLFGRGDPSFATRGEHGMSGSTLEGLAGALLQSGVRFVRGNLLVNDHYFSDSAYGAGWMVEDLDSYYCPEVSALSFNDNVAAWRVAPGPAVSSPARVGMIEPDTGLVWSNRATTVAAKASTRISGSRYLGQNRGVVTGTIAVDAPPATNLITVHDPALWFGRALAARLRARGVTISGSVRAAAAQGQEAERLPGGNWRELAMLESPPLRELLPGVMKPSNNLHAQLLFLLVGAQAGPAPEPLSTSQASVAALEAWMRGVLSPGLLPRLEEGAGLSRRNGASPRHIVDLLRHMDRHASASVFKESLPVAGVDGTLKQRMRGTLAENNLRAKTGSLRGVSSLSGYVTTLTGERLAFAILLNDYIAEPGQPAGRDEVDAIAVMLPQYGETARP
ncbi:MAG: D-alanyl-D-alanine carboxypeptidase/D-alanyl-D-alanine-endopeptidase [Verrucomicrobia bacterium]|nr:D-alanyl-D-alanine carboxypeptidase/D-alanyl-D-alanine-endopeptidase [Verrucomicrobiota bacterium]